MNTPPLKSASYLAKLFFVISMIIIKTSVKAGPPPIIIPINKISLRAPTGNIANNASPAQPQTVDSRTTVAVGEIVSLILQDNGHGLAKSWSVSSGGSTVSGDSTTATFTADEILTNATVTVTCRDNTTATITFTILTPTGEVALINSSNTMQFSGYAGADMQLSVLVQPTYVCFYRAANLEIAVDPTIDSGGYFNWYVTQFGNSQLIHHPTTPASRYDSYNQITDNAYFQKFPANIPGTPATWKMPTSGSSFYAWVIPNKYNVIGKGPHDMPGSNQKMEITASNGSSTVTKIFSGTDETVNGDNFIHNPTKPRIP